MLPLFFFNFPLCFCNGMVIDFNSNERQNNSTPILKIEFPIDFERRAAIAFNIRINFHWYVTKYFQIKKVNKKKIKDIFYNRENFFRTFSIYWIKFSQYLSFFKIICKKFQSLKIQDGLLAPTPIKKIRYINQISAYPCTISKSSRSTGSNQKINSTCCSNILPNYSNICSFCLFSNPNQHVPQAYFREEIIIQKFFETNIRMRLCCYIIFAEVIIVTAFLKVLLTHHT